MGILGQLCCMCRTKAIGQCVSRELRESRQLGFKPAGKTQESARHCKFDNDNSAGHMQPLRPSRASRKDSRKVDPEHLPARPCLPRASASTMSCVVEELPFDPTDFDKYLGDLLIGHEGHPQQFLESIFSFLKRKTNFFKEPEPKRRVLEALRTVAPEAVRADGFKGGFFGAAPKPSAAAAPKPAPVGDTAAVRSW